MNGTELKNWREKHPELTQKQVAEWLGLSGNNAVYKIEKGLRKIKPAEEKILRDMMAMYDAKVNPESTDFNFTPAEMSQMSRYAKTDGIADPKDWANLKIKAYLAELKKSESTIYSDKK